MEIMKLLWQAKVKDGFIRLHYDNLIDKSVQLKGTMPNAHGLRYLKFIRLEGKEIARCTEVDASNKSRTSFQGVGKR